MYINLFLFFYCTLGSGVHVQIVQDCCIGTYMIIWFAASIPPITYIWHFSPCYSSPISLCPTAPTLVPPTDPGVWYSHPCVHVFSLFNTHLWVKTSVFDFLYLCQFAENDGFQIHPCLYKGHKLIVFYSCIVFHVVYVPHCASPVYYWWTFGLAPGLCYCKQCLSEHMCACVFIIEQLIILWIYPQ